MTVRMSLDWTIVEVTLGPDSERPVYRSWVLGVGDNMRTRLGTSASAHRGVQGERLTLRTMGSWDSG